MDPYLGEIILFAGKYPPPNYVFCQGQLLSISDNTALFGLIGTTYGGDGQNTFALPDLRGRIAIAQGAGSGLSNYVVGEAGGTESVSLNADQMPVHSHNVLVGGGAFDNMPRYNLLLGDETQDFDVPAPIYAKFNPGATVDLSWISILATGSGAAHSNVQPVLALNYCIALAGVIPQPASAK